MKRASIMRARRFGIDEKGVSAIEFALVLPILLTLFFSGYIYSEALTIKRKVTITTRALADLTTQNSTMATADITTVMNASSQIMAPFPTTTLSTRLTEITTDALGVTASITWSLPVNTTYVKGALYTGLPVAMLQPNASYILSEVTYKYTPISGYKVIGPFTLYDHILMIPRASQSVVCTDC